MDDGPPRNIAGHDTLCPYEECLKRTVNADRARTKNANLEIGDPRKANGAAYLVWKRARSTAAAMAL